MNKEDAAVILEALNNVEKLAKKYPNHGICGLVEDQLLEYHSCKFDSWIDDNINRWALFSGDKKSPVPFGTHDPGLAYLGIKEKWSNDEYGNNRRNLLYWLIAQFRGMAE